MEILFVIAAFATIVAALCAVVSYGYSLWKWIKRKPSSSPKVAK
jgi:hypothetical protein